ncbi:protein containing DUF523 [Candidatus Desulfofervidus auxilii]|uniref:DUF523 domain-containing protein n=1 Tax=Desulfofervidus auxilii TaxID=1621989 RepID=A0A7V1N2M0_DESA2|nr:DUF523 domain-containing protein [Candidatus Desulfofervidus auxilii]CAD7778240.1 hypothetical protein BLFGPEAP_01925 [Candidatus Methanoperedenaceae archaeon GB50]CAD7779371.1 hypothetical protein DMNBHIDG_02048 [Candidatus Methanoperedenaceae archaeon GB37]AMM41452.1 protein containing DUF523 [Candidatus Desulfofervidus auxilii]CAD7782792.1 MAG: hypothetical protein KCCBMMGE_01528 [Candidatus Methanoperedenaceae archaeon GB37]HEB74121.1 DUF523 domain-containing protein [Candidatus Desulfo
MILVSACLIGLKCRYDGTNAFCNELMDFLKDKNYLPVCPEQLGGLPTPRAPAVIVGGDGFDVQKLKARVINEAQEDVTFNFLQGAKKTLELADLFGVERCYLKERSPSCGVNWVYKKEGLSRGCGVTTALLLKNGYAIIGV